MFALLQLGNRAAASEVLTEAFVSCYRGGLGQEDAKALEVDAFRAAFELSGSARYALADRSDDILPDRRLAGLPALERAAVILTFFCRFTARDAADILGASAGRVRDLNLQWIGFLCP
jgi:DNA-directed RNA polymerase specialized sigma24 family protein